MTKHKRQGELHSRFSAPQDRTQLGLIMKSTSMTMLVNCAESTSQSLMDGDDVEDDESAISDSSNDGDDQDDLDSDDRELQEAFARGEIDSSRLNHLVPFIRRDVVNNKDGLNRAIESLSKSTSISAPLAWFERMDVNNDPAPVAPELAEHLDEQLQQQRNEKSKRQSRSGDVDDDFKREVTFYRQAQGAVFEGLARVRELGIPTRRPEDYFAQMLKSDDHMQKVREVLVNKQLVMERREKARKLRELKKYGKQVQNEVLLRRAKEKRETLESVKKFRRGQKDKLDFLGDEIGRPPAAGKAKAKTSAAKGGKDQQKNNKRQPASTRKKAKDAKYGFGGKKKRGKYNDAESSADVSGYRRSSAQPSKKRPANNSSKRKPKGGKNHRKRK